VCQELAIPVRASIGYDGPSELPRVRMSATELTQVLINVVSNAAQAVAARGAPHGRVSIGARAIDETLELCVRDDGVGMTPEVLNRVGTPFFTTRPEGTGLGLAQCQRLVGTVGGRFRIDSECGIGTTVTIVLPTVPTTS
jgi:signal transduction histidine kinase